MTGRRINAPGNEEKASDIQTPEEGPDKYVVSRAMSSALSAIRSKCARYLKTGRTIDDDRLESMEGDYTLVLSMPDRWNFGATTRLTTLMHDHAVNYCVYSIFEKTNPEEAQGYYAKAEIELNEIKPILELRIAPVRRATNMY